MSRISAAAFSRPWPPRLDALRRWLLLRLNEQLQRLRSCARCRYADYGDGVQLTQYPLSALRSQFR